MVETDVRMGNRENPPATIDTPPSLSRPPLIGPRPDPISVRIADFPGGTTFPPQTAPWGKFLFALSGVVEFDIDGRQCLSPPAYALWIPPHCEHASRARQATRYAAVYVEQPRCDSLPHNVAALRCTGIALAIVQDLAARRIEVPASAEDLRLADVLLDQIRLSPAFASYLPLSDDPAIARIMAAITQSPGDRRGLAQWAEAVGISERSLSRRWRERVGMSFHDWRQRAKLVAALAMLEEDGASIDQISRRLGYNSASSFIAMVRARFGVSPERMRREQRPGDSRPMALLVRGHALKNSV